MTPPTTSVKRPKHWMASYVPRVMALALRTGMAVVPRDLGYAHVRLRACQAGAVSTAANTNRVILSATARPQPRIRQPPYSNPRYPWRERHVGAEIGPPMAYVA